ncbi:MAG: restriction endonuclease [Candidatus Poribacteria bacterium]|nr:restriction endonuclease [Candidatus Poribacteria bacterium]MDE0314492.1 restriction endonuclease [Candidatus Poribacteria bacterium]
MKETVKSVFSTKLNEFVKTLNSYVETANGQWTIKGFIDIYRRIYTISTDTKIVSKLLEIHLLPQLLAFAEENGYTLIPAEKQNYYPDISLISETGDHKFALDFKTTYRLPENPEFCNGFTLGSHGNYFIERDNRKNIQFPYNEYMGHFCLGIIYTRASATSVDETELYTLEHLNSIPSVIRDFQFFAVEKWRIASDRRGSGNTANIGSINKIADILSGNGMFGQLGEKWFDDYWMNYRKITVQDDTGKTTKITNLHDFVVYRGGDTNLVVPRASQRKARSK